MNPHNEINVGPGAISVLVVSPTAEDHEVLGRTLDVSHWTLCSASDIDAAMRQLRRNRDISLVICDHEFWKQLLARTAELPSAPLIIIAATHADDRLWAEALNVGAYDVLAKPFETAEVVRSLSLAWLHRSREHKPLMLSPRTASI